MTVLNHNVVHGTIIVALPGKSSLVGIDNTLSGASTLPDAEETFSGRARERADLWLNRMVKQWWRTICNRNGLHRI
jgi:hypothetical protein